jgi:hypothetical protein
MFTILWLRIDDSSTGWKAAQSSPAGRYGSTAFGRTQSRRTLGSERTAPQFAWGLDAPCLTGETIGPTMTLFAPPERPRKQALHCSQLLLRSQGSQLTASIFSALR